MDWDGDEADILVMQLTFFTPSPQSSLSCSELKLLLSGFHRLVVSRLWLQSPPEPDAAGGRGHDHWPGGGAGGAGEAAPAPPRQLQPHAEAGGEVTLCWRRGQGQPQASQQPQRGRHHHQDTSLRHNEHEVRLDIYITGRRHG